MKKARPVDTPSDSSPRWLPWALGLGMLLVYGVSATSHLVGADNGEFVILAAQGGRAHPPGYPLYTLYLRSLDWLPALNAAHRASLATALLGAGCVVILYRACRSWGASATASLGAALLFGLSPQIWFLHSHAEVFALNNLLAAALLWLAAPNAPLQGGARLLALGLVAGLGLSNHHSIVLLAPLGLFGLYRGWLEAKRPLVWLLLAAVALVAGLSPYAYLLSASDCVDCFKWGQFQGVGDIVDHFLRRDYGTTQLDYYGGERKPLAHLAALVAEVSADYQYAGVLLAIFGAGALWRRTDRRAPGRLGGAALCAGVILSGPVFVMLFNRAPEGVGLEVARRFYALPQLLLAVCVAFGIERVRPWLAQRPRMLSAGLIAAFATMLVASSLVRLSAYYRPTLDNYARNTLASLPEDAILVGSGDARFLSIEYLRRVEHVRDDVDFVHSSLLRFDWYLERVEEQLGVDIPHTTRDSGLLDVEPAGLVDALHASERAVFWAAAPADELDAYVVYPHATATRILPAGQAAPDADTLVAHNAELFDDFQLDEPPPAGINPWGWWLYAEYPRAWRELATFCERREQRACAERAAQRARSYDR